MYSTVVGVICIIIAVLIYVMRRKLEQMTRRVQKAILPEGVGWTEDTYKFARIMRVVGAILLLILGLYILIWR